MTSLKLYEKTNCQRFKTGCQMRRCHVYYKPSNHRNLHSGEVRKLVNHLLSKWNMEFDVENRPNSDFLDRTFGDKLYKITDLEGRFCGLQSNRLYLYYHYKLTIQLNSIFFNQKNPYQRKQNQKASPKDILVRNKFVCNFCLLNPSNNESKLVCFKDFRFENSAKLNTFYNKINFRNSLFPSNTYQESNIYTEKFRSMAASTNGTAQPVQAEQLNLKVKSQDGQEIFFKIKTTTQLKKLMDAYCQRQSLNINNVRFLFDGQRLHDNQTPKDLNMQNGDEIDVVIQQVGGI